MIFLDANVLLYYLDETATQNHLTVSILQKLVDDNEQLVSSHHVIEEVLFVFLKHDTTTRLTSVVRRIAELPGLILIEPEVSIEFATRYASLCNLQQMGVNDALLLQLMLDAHISHLFTYDQQFAAKARQVNIQLVDTATALI